MKTDGKSYSALYLQLARPPNISQSIREDTMGGPPLHGLHALLHRQIQIQMQIHTTWNTHTHGYLIGQSVDKDIHFKCKRQM